MDVSRWRSLSLLFAICATTACAQTPATSAKVDAAAAACGTHASDWCTAPGDDPCGSHADAASCVADPRCTGMAYRGESLVKCQYDARGFHGNCPVVGCRSTPVATPPQH